MRRVLLFLLLFITSVNMYAGDILLPRCSVSAQQGNVVDMGVISSINSYLSVVEMKFHVNCEDEIPLVFTLIDRQSGSLAAVSSQAHFGLGRVNGVNIGYFTFTPVNQSNRVDGASSFGVCSTVNGLENRPVDYLFRDGVFFLCPSSKSETGHAVVPLSGKHFELTLLVSPYLYDEFKRSSISEEVNLNADVLFDFRIGL